MPSDDMELARTRFLEQIHQSKLDMSLGGAFLQYWQQVEAESQSSQDLAQLDRWNRDLLRDKDRLAELRAREQQAASSQMASDDQLKAIRQLLALLDDIGRKLRRRLTGIRDRIAWWVWAAGPGRKSKPVPGGGGEDEKTEKDQKKDQAKQAVLAKDKVKKGPKKTKAG